MIRGRDKDELGALLPGRGQNKEDTTWRTAVNAGVDSITGWNPHDYMEPFQSPARVAAAANNVRNTVSNMMGGPGRTESTPYQDILQAAMNYAPRALAGAAGVVDRMPATAFMETTGTGIDPIDPARIREGVANAWDKYGDYLSPFIVARANPNFDINALRRQAGAAPSLPSMVNEAMQEMSMSKPIPYRSKMVDDTVTVNENRPAYITNAAASVNPSVFDLVQAAFNRRAR